MPYYRLSPGEEVRVPHRALEVTAWDTRARAPVPVRADAGPDGTTGAWYPNPDVMVLPAVPGPVVLRAVPPGGAPAFGVNATVTTQLRTVPGPDETPVEVLLDAVPISGRAAPDLLVLEPDGPVVRVRAMRASTEGPVAGLAARVGVEARRLGADGVADDQRASLVVGVDVSGSMRGSLADGSVAALAEAVAGLGRVVGDGGPVRTVLLGRVPRWLPPVPEAEIGAAVSAEVRRSELELGFRPSDAGIRPGPGRTVVYLVTDAEPPDLDVLAADRVEWHVLIAGAPAGAPRSGPVPCTVLAPPPTGTLATAHLMSPDAASSLTALVASLITHWTAADGPGGGIR